MEKQETFPRLQSLDALRGFDMLFIMGGGAFFVALATLIPTPFFQGIAAQMEHVYWNGCHLEDMIFPTFLFIAGISFPFSLAKQRSQGKSRKAIYLKIIRRGLTLVLLGFLYNGILSHLDFTTARYASVLGRIGLAWMFAALIFVDTKASTRIWVTLLCLLGYWLMLNYIPVPDADGAGKYTMEGSFTGYFDRICLPGQLYKEVHDPEGLLGTIPAIATALLGMFCGEFVKINSSKWSGNKKTITMIIAAVVLIIIGRIWNLAFPINKNLWSSSFVCFVGGISMLCFAIFYYIIDVRNCRGWTFFFRVIGMNSITIYLAQKFINFHNFNDQVFRGLAALVPHSAEELVVASGYILTCWLFLYILYRQKIFLKV